MTGNKNMIKITDFLIGEHKNEPRELEYLNFRKDFLKSKVN